MANVAFKRGLSSALKAEGFTAADGVFYLTTDTHRLYVGQDSNLIELNRYVKVVDKSTNLPASPAKDDFAFVTEGNMLLVCTNPSGTGTGKWTQINPPDTNTDTTISVKGTPTVTSDSTGVTVKFIFSQVENNRKTEGVTAKADIPVEFKIAASDIATANEIAVAIGSKAASGGGSTISISGAGSSASSVTLKQGSNVTITDDGKNNITIAAADTKYTLSAGVNAISLTADGTTPSGSVAVAGDGTYITATVDADNGLKVSHKTYSANLAGTAQTAETLKHGGEFTVVTGVARDTGGHITSYNTKKFTLPTDNNTFITKAAIAAADKGNLTITLTDSNSNPISATTADASGNGPLYMLVGKNGTKVFNQGTLDVYTTSEIDEKINGINAMVYKGTVGGDGATVSSLPTSGVAIGDTYMVAKAGTYGTHSCDIGDLLIATGTESNGIISGTITWTYVPSGDDTDTQYVLSNNNNVINLRVKGTPTGGDSITLAAGTAMAVSGTTGTITIGHDNVTCTPGTAAAVSGYGGKFNAITGITVNAQGHVTGYTTTAVTMPSAQAVNHSLSIGDNHSIVLTHPDGTSTSAISLAASDGITLVDDASKGTITVGHKAYTTAITPSTATAQTLSHGGKFTVVTAVARDATGHVSGYTTKEFTLPGDNNTTYSLAGSARVTNGIATISSTLTANGTTPSGTASATVKSSSLVISAPSSTTNTIAIDLEWGSF